MDCVTFSYHNNLRIAVVSRPVLRILVSVSVSRVVVSVSVLVSKVLVSLTSLI